MSSTKKLYGFFDDDDILIKAVKTLKAEGVAIVDAYTPFPVHGLDKALELKPTRLAITSFLYGIVGFCVAIWLTWFTMIQDWPQDIGGKPSMTWLQNMPAFVPIMFEMTVFFAAHLMVITFLLRSKLWPGREGENPDPRTTDDLFALEFDVHDDEDELRELLKAAGAVEIRVKEIAKDKKERSGVAASTTMAIMAAGLFFGSCASDDGKQVEFFPNMYKSEAYEAYAPNALFADSLGALLPVEGTIVRGFVPYEMPDTPEGYERSKTEVKNPMLATAADMKQGKELYAIYCTPCHGDKGDGNGILVQNEKILGVPSYEAARLPDITDGSVYHVITYGKGIMGSHASQLKPNERWQIVHYVNQLREELN